MSCTRKIYLLYYTQAPFPIPTRPMSAPVFPPGNEFFFHFLVFSYVFIFLPDNFLDRKIVCSGFGGFFRIIGCSKLAFGSSFPNTSIRFMIRPMDLHTIPSMTCPPTSLRVVALTFLRSVYRGVDAVSI